MRSRLILASISPRRRQLLRRTGLPFSVRPSGFSEAPHSGESPRRRAARLARAKAQAVVARLRRPAWVIGADTLVVASGEVLEKPRDDAEARRMLQHLSGNWHRVISAVAFEPAGLPGERATLDWRTTRVRFAPLDARRIEWILAAREHADKAGGYAVQGRAGLFIRELRGSDTNVIGLPLDLVVEELTRLGYLPGDVNGR